MARKSMNIVDTVAWIKRAANDVRGRHIANLYYDKEGGMFFIKLKGGWIILSEPGKRVHFTSRRQPPSEFKPDPLVVLARKYMRNRRLSDVSLVGHDRIVSFATDNGYRIIVELVPRGIVALVSPEGVILAASRYATLRDRVIKPKKPYNPPPSRGKPIDQLTVNDIVDAVERRGKLVSGLVSILGIPGELAEEAVHRAGLQPDLDTIDIGEAVKVLRRMNEILEEAFNGRGYIVTKEGTGIEVDPFYPSRYENGYSIIEYDDFNTALEEFFELYIKAKPASKVAEADSERYRLLASLEKAQQQARRYREEAELLRRLADGISRNYELFSKFMDCVRARGEACLEEYKIQGVLDSGRLILTVNDYKVDIPLKVKSIDDLIIELFKRAGTLEAKAERAEMMRVEIEEKLKELSIKAKSREIGELYKKRKRYWFETFHFTLTRNGFLAVGGKDASQNELLVRRYLDPHDIFMHADIHGAPAVVVKTKGNVPSEEDLYDSAVIGVAYSKGWKAGIGSIRVFYVTADQVSLSPPTGEYLAKGGIMVYGRKNYLRPVPVRIWLGIGLDNDGIPRIIQGSREVVERYSLVFASLIPGEEKRLDVARELKQKFSQMMDYDVKPFILAVPEQDLASRIPGRARITGVWKGKANIINFKEFLV
ncbi:MAG: NFACT family protein [Desulfurococcales archaeon]|nr:NFACT family protein [Desulfurococcales archaeon]